MFPSINFKNKLFRSIENSNKNQQDNFDNEKVIIIKIIFF